MHCVSNIEFGNNEITPHRMSTKCVVFIIIDKWKTAFVVACKVRFVLFGMAKIQICLAAFSGSLPYR
jgi:hypothetical protein